MPLKNTALRYQVLLEGLKTKHAAEFATVVQDIGRTVAEWSQELGTGKLSDMERREYMRLIVDLQERLAERLAERGKELLGALPEIGVAAANFETRTLNREVDYHFSPPDDDTVDKEVRKQPLSANGKLPQVFVEEWLAKQPQVITDYAQKAYANGLTVQQMVQGIRGTKARGFKDGLLATTQREAEAIARTTVQHAASLGRMQTWNENKDVVQGYQFVATLDARTTTICRSLDGRVWPLEGGPVPPLHINCRSTTVAKLDPELDFLDEGATRSSIEGPVDASLSYYDWLATQSKEFQDEVLGPARGALFRDGGLSPKEFADLQLDKTFKPLTLEEMQAREPLAFEKAGLGASTGDPAELAVEVLQAPAPGTATGRVWDIADGLKTGDQLPSRKEVIDAAVAAGINPATASTQYRLWKIDRTGGGEAPTPTPAPAPAPAPAPDPETTPTTLPTSPNPIPLPATNLVIEVGPGPVGTVDTQRLIDKLGERNGRYTNEIDRYINTRFAGIAANPPSVLPVEDQKNLREWTDALLRKAATNNPENWTVGLPKGATSKSIDLQRQLLKDDPKQFEKLIKGRANERPATYELRVVPIKDIIRSQYAEGAFNGSSMETAEDIANVEGPGDLFRIEDIAPITLNKNGMLIDGNHRTTAAIINGDTHILALVRVDDNVAGVTNFAESQGALLGKPVVPPTPVPPPPPKPPAPTTVVVQAVTGTATEKVRTIAGNLTTALGRLPTRTEVLAETEKHGINPATASTQFQRWKKEQGTAPPVAIPVPRPGPIVDIKEPTPAPKPTSKPAQKSYASAVTEAVGSDPRLKKLATDISNASFLGHIDKVAQLKKEKRELELSKVQGILASPSPGKQTYSQDFGPKAQSPALKQAIGERLNKAISFLEQVVHSDILESVKVQVEYIGKGRSYYSPSTGKVGIDSQSDVSIYIHEIVHLYEDKNKSLDNLARAFLAKRSGGELPINLKETVSSRYHESEIAYDDRWVERGGSVYTGRIYRDSGSEVLTMGLERLFKDPVEFASRDPEHFDFVLNALHKTSW